jgi:hypothetical protein
MGVKILKFYAHFRPKGNVKEKQHRKKHHPEKLFFLQKWKTFGYFFNARIVYSP